MIPNLLRAEHIHVHSTSRSWRSGKVSASQPKGPRFDSQPHFTLLFYFPLDLGNSPVWCVLCLLVNLSLDGMPIWQDTQTWQDTKNVQLWLKTLPLIYFDFQET